MREIPKISEAEWKVMKILWVKSPLNSTQIIEALKSNSDWSPKTIHTLISRLVKKQAIGINKEASLYEYYPIIDENECKRIETNSFIRKVYNGSIKMLIKNFIKDEKLTKEEIEELKKILNEKENERGR